MNRNLSLQLSSAQRIQPIKWLALFLLVTCIILFIVFLRANPDPNFWFVPNLPVPPFAMRIMRSDMPLNDGSLGGYRLVTFETDQPVDTIRQFYRQELLKRGWYFLCSPTQLEEPDCPLGLSPGIELAEAYQRDDEPSQVRAINVDIYKPGENLVASTNRLVEVIEYRYPLPSP